MCQNTETEYKMTCPLCSHDMPLSEFPSPDNWREDKAYAWICSNCPTVALEWVDETDSKAFLEHLVLPTHKPVETEILAKKYIGCSTCDGVMPKMVVRSYDNGVESESIRWICQPEPCPIQIAYVPEEKDRIALMDSFRGKEEEIHDYTDEVLAELDRKQEEENEREFAKPEPYRVVKGTDSHPIVIDLNGSTLKVKKLEYVKPDISETYYHDCYITFANNEVSRYDAGDVTEYLPGENPEDNIHE